MVVDAAVADDQPGRRRQQPEGDHHPGKQKIGPQEKSGPPQKAPAPARNRRDSGGKAELYAKQQPKRQLRQKDKQRGEPAGQRRQSPPPGPAPAPRKMLGGQQQKPGDVQVEPYKDICVDNNDRPPPLPVLIIPPRCRKRGRIGPLMPSENTKVHIYLYFK